MKVWIFASLLALAWAESKFLGDLPMQNPDLFEGDILGIESPEERNAIPYPQMRWPGGVVPFTIDASLSRQRNLIIQSMNHIMTRTGYCISFRERTNERNYIRIFLGDGCYSMVGMINQGGQPVSLGNGCHFLGTIVHEFLHALGFFHEQNRSDRDNYLNIYWQNIGEGMADQFKKLADHENILYDNFDYDSIMLYGDEAFTKRPGLKTMTPKIAGVRMIEVYDKPGLAASDIYRIKRLYQC